MLVISLIEENIFPVVALSGVLLEDSVSRNAMLFAELLPELITNYQTIN